MQCKLRWGDIALDRSLGTRALVFPQPRYVPGYERPELVWLSPPAGTLRPGPADDLLEVVRSRQPKAPYAFPYLPPFRGPRLAQVVPGADGHLDSYAPDASEFPAVHAYAGVRLVIDLWQSYLGEPIAWFFRPRLPRLEIVAEIDWPNAQAGFGYIELGGDLDEHGRFSAYALNLDVIAHETAHLVLWSVMGAPRNDGAGSVFGAFHEAFADLTALLTLLHFDTAIDRILRRVKAELWLRNELNRIGELVDERQIRVASHAYKHGEGSGTVHDRSRPITGALFDWLVDLYVDALDDRGLIDRRLLQNLKLAGGLDEGAVDEVQAMFARALATAPFAFRTALQNARDSLGRVLAATVRRLDPEAITPEILASALLASATGLGGRAQARLEESLAWRRLLPAGTFGRPAFGRLSFPVYR